MKTRNLYITLLTIILTAAITQAEEKPDQELSYTRQATVNLRITTDPKTFPMGTERDNSERLSNLMFDPEVARTVWKEIDTSDWNEFAEVDMEEPIEIGGLQTVRIRIWVSLKDNQKPAAKEFLTAYIKRVKEELLKEHDIVYNFHGEKLTVYFQRKDRAEMELHHLLSDQGALAGGRGALDKESVRQRILEHERALMKNDMQRNILAKRAEATARQIAEIRDKTNEVIHNDEITRNLEELLSQRKSDLERMEKESMENPNHIIMGIPEFRERMIQIKMQLAERKQQLRNEVGEDAHELSRQLREITTRLEEMEIEERFRREYSGGSLDDSMRYEMLEVRIEAAKENLRRTIIELDEAALKIDLLQPPIVSYDEIICSEEAAK